MRPGKSLAQLFQISAEAELKAVRLFQSKPDLLKAEGMSLSRDYGSRVLFVREAYAIFYPEGLLMYTLEAAVAGKQGLQS